MITDKSIVQEALLGPGENNLKILCRIPKVLLEMMLSGGIAAFNTPDATIVLQANFADTGRTFEQWNERMAEIMRNDA